MGAPAHASSDPTFYRSPAEAGAAPAEKLAYVVAFDRTAQRPDALTVVDVDPAGGQSRLLPAAYIALRAHDPEASWGFVGVVVSTQDLSASVWRWHRDGKTWAADKVITIAAEPPTPICCRRP
jgi:hypothetical protein